MSCTVGDRSCETPRRRLGLVMLALMTLVFVLLSIFSFVKSHNQATPDQFTYKGYSADAGKRVFQAYNCMDCHTIVGNGAYFAPDLTDIYGRTGAAWLEAFIPSAGSWPTKGAVTTQLMDKQVLADANVDSIDAYLKKYPEAASRIERRGGHDTAMPNLQFRKGEVEKLIAFFKYTSALNTRGWPPEVKSGSLDKRLEKLYGPVIPPVSAAPVETISSQKNKGKDLATKGQALAKEYACTSCHATDTGRKVGPGWGGLYNSEVVLSNGETVIADEDYLFESIVKPDAKVVNGYPAGVMPSYAGTLNDDQVDALVAYLVSLAN